ncbi:unnamed protein product, partial [Chrysoparadoxa australica]
QIVTNTSTHSLPVFAYDGSLHTSVSPDAAVPGCGPDSWELGHDQGAAALAGLKPDARSLTVSAAGSCTEGDPMPITDFKESGGTLVLGFGGIPAGARAKRRFNLTNFNPVPINVTGTFLGLQMYATLEHISTQVVREASPLLLSIATEVTEGRGQGTLALPQVVHTEDQAKDALAAGATRTRCSLNRAGGAPVPGAAGNADEADMSGVQGEGCWNSTEFDTRVLAPGSNAGVGIELVEMQARKLIRESVEGGRVVSREEVRLDSTKEKPVWVIPPGHSATFEAAVEVPGGKDFGASKGYGQIKGLRLETPAESIPIHVRQYALIFQSANGAFSFAKESIVLDNALPGQEQTHPLHLSSTLNQPLGLRGLVSSNSLFSATLEAPELPGGSADPVEIGSVLFKPWTQANNPWLSVAHIMQLRGTMAPRTKLMVSEMIKAAQGLAQMSRAHTQEGTVTTAEIEASQTLERWWKFAVTNRLNVMQAVVNVNTEFGSASTGATITAEANMPSCAIR